MCDTLGQLIVVTC